MEDDQVTTPESPAPPCLENLHDLLVTICLCQLQCCQTLPRPLKVQVLILHQGLEENVILFSETTGAKP